MRQTSDLDLLDWLGRLCYVCTYRLLAAQVGFLETDSTHSEGEKDWGAPRPAGMDRFSGDSSARSSRQVALQTGSTQNQLNRLISGGWKGKGRALDGDPKLRITSGSFSGGF